MVRLLVLWKEGREAAGLVSSLGWGSGPVVCVYIGAGARPTGCWAGHLGLLGLYKRAFSVLEYRFQMVCLFKDVVLHLR